MEAKAAPRIKTSQRRIQYKSSAWCVHEFEVWSGELVCRVAALRMKDSLLLWIGGNAKPALVEVAAGVPMPPSNGSARAGLATALISGDGVAVTLARRLSATLVRPVYVCCGATFDRFTAPLVERGLIAEIKSRPECF
ncbi:uncharacterized protein LOC115446869 [Manduca sexta]|uniref:Uncharacterized protein n=1 Tax=Manduca sexta TaxID=7130 RepID=A0A921ZD35_MANSE|nr:uncharacterized protein LOC115446869 [Manduca sexta]KAG6455355.1 hypothetical protein O3G_MSEX009169 [Manduca sexta]